MATYRTGRETRETLYRTARASFWQSGCDATSIKDIVRNANSQLGLFSYYFEGKESLALDILFTFRTEVERALDAHPAIAALHDDALALDAARSYLWLLLLCEYKNPARFVREVSLCSSFLSRSSYNRRRFCALFADDPAVSGGDPNDVQTMLTASMMSGMMTQLCHDLPSMPLGDDRDKAIRAALRSHYLLCARDPMRLQASLNRAFSACQTLRLQALDDFTVTVEEIK